MDVLASEPIDSVGLKQASFLGQSPPSKEKLTFISHDRYRRTQCTRELYEKCGGEVMAFLDSLQ
jgi:hypothetical protein